MSKRLDTLITKIAAEVEAITAKPTLSLYDIALILAYQKIISEAIEETQIEIKRVRLAQEDAALRRIGSGLN